MAHEIFRPHHHIPQFSIILMKTLLKTPLLVYFAVAGNLLTMAAAYVFYYFERTPNPNVNSYWDAVWWAMCTVSTVGYGDIVPITTPGRIAAIFLIIVGVMFFLSFMAVLVSAMSNEISRLKSESE